jgi:hypothetical protein
MKTNKPPKSTHLECPNRSIKSTNKERNKGRQSDLRHGARTRAELELDAIETPTRREAGSLKKDNKCVRTQLTLISRNNVRAQIDLQTSDG